MTSRTASNQIFASVTPSTPPKEICKAAKQAPLENQKLASPDRSHVYSELGVSQSPFTGKKKKAHKMMLRQFSGKKEHTLTSSEAIKRDMKRIRIKEGVETDNEERIIVESPEKKVQRAYKSHVNPNPNGQKRLYPVELPADSHPRRDPQVITFKGPEVLSLLSQWNNTNSTESFENFAVKRGRILFPANENEAQS